MIHYHGTPITPDTCALRVLKARHAFVSFAHPGQMGLAAAECQSFALDNGAFPMWTAGLPTDWPAFYAWVRYWSNHPGFDFAVIPDVIEGSVEENDELVRAWPLAKHIGAPVWHTNEPPERLVQLASEWPRVCIGSSGQYDVKRPAAFVERAQAVIMLILNDDGFPITKLHGLRCLNPDIFTQLPLASGDSTNIARNIGIDAKWKGTYQPKSKETRAMILAERIESHNSAGEW